MNNTTTISTLPTQIQSTNSGNQQSFRDTMIKITPLIFSLGLGGVITDSIKTSINFIWSKLTAKTYSDIKFSSQGDLYREILDYLTETGKVSKTSSRMKASIKAAKSQNWWSDLTIQRISNKKEIEFIPGPGRQEFEYKGKTVVVDQSEAKLETVGWNRQPTEMSSLYLSYLGKDPQILKDLIDEAINHKLEHQGGTINIYEYHEWGFWQKISNKKARTLESVILDGNLAQEIVDDIQTFMKSKKWYADRGVPYRRGYLLHGPPGTGKTSFTEAVAGSLNLNICYMNLSGGQLNDDSLNDALIEAPGHSIILLEDIDALFVQRESAQKGNAISFSGLLNALDGIRSQEGRLLFMTTNHIEKLDPALKRPGRADVTVEMKNASQKQMKEIFIKFYPGENKLVEQFANQLPEFKVSMAKLQGHILKNRESAKGAVDTASEMLEEQTSMIEMSIGEWLDRLNLSQFYKKFYDKKIYRVNDLSDVSCDRDLMDQFEIMDFMPQKRIIGMLNGVAHVKEKFQYQSKHQCRTAIQMYIKNEEQVQLFVDNIPEFSLTGFQLRDILDQNTSLGEVKDSFLDRIQRSSEVKKGLLKVKPLPDEKDKKDEEDKKKKSNENKSYPNYSIDTFLKEVGIEDKMEKLKENELLDPEIFWDLTEDQFESLVGVDVYGTRKKLFLRLEEIKKQHYEQESMEMSTLTNQKSENFVTLFKQKTILY